MVLIFYYVAGIYINFRIRDALQQNLDVVDVDGSYLYRKEQQLISQGVRTLPLSLSTTIVR